MFLVDVSSSMGNVRTVEVESSDGDTHTVEMTNLAWGLQYVKLKIQDMVRPLCLPALSVSEHWPRYSITERQNSAASFYLVQRVLSGQDSFSFAC